MKREAGILMPISSLPGTLGIGDFGKTAYEWVDMMDKSGAGLWQILPLNPLGYGNSPYQTYSSFAGDEIYISIEKLFLEMNIPFKKEVWESNFVDYEAVRKRKLGLLKIAYEHFKPNQEYESFLNYAFWLEDYVAFIALKRQNDYRSWLDWENLDLDDEQLNFERFIQYIFFKQWMDLKSYANEKSIQIVGDLPIYVGHDSSDVYHNREFFYLDGKNHPSQVAGVPPDNFSEDGQLWGNPLYKWDKLKADNYSYWVDKLRWNQILFDVIRLDHFRAFDTYWAIPGGSETAKIGEWRLGPAHDFFNVMFEEIENLNIVVEDLGDLRPEVLALRDDFNFKGMKIIQFLLKDHELIENMHMSENFIAYTGTHDNKTMAGHLEEDISEDRQAALMSRLPHYGETLVERICFYTMSLNASWAILPLQDLLSLDNKARINTPATLGSPNWEWKLNDFDAVYQAMRDFATMVSVTNRHK